MTDPMEPMRILRQALVESLKQDDVPVEVGMFVLLVNPDPDEPVECQVVMEVDDKPERIAGAADDELLAGFDFDSLEAEITTDRRAEKHQDALQHLSGWLSGIEEEPEPKEE